MYPASLGGMGERDGMGFRPVDGISRPPLVLCGLGRVLKPIFGHCYLVFNFTKLSEGQNVPFPPKAQFSRAKWATSSWQCGESGAYRGAGRDGRKVLVGFGKGGRGPHQNSSGALLILPNARRSGAGHTSLMTTPPWRWTGLHYAFAVIIVIFVGTGVQHGLRWTRAAGHCLRPSRGCPPHPGNFP